MTKETKITDSHKKHEHAHKNAEDEARKTESPEGQGQAQADKMTEVAVIEGEEILKLREKLALLEKQGLYLRADFDNFRRNVSKEKQTWTADGEDGVLKEIFNVLEMLERAIDAGKKLNVTAGVIDGLELVRKEINLMFQRHGVEAIPAEGQKFGPKVHDAVGVLETSEMEEGMIVAVHRPGFMRQGRVLRPSEVIVAKAKSGPTVH